MPLDYDRVMARRSADRRIEYDDTRMLLYNLSVGMGRDPSAAAGELAFVFERPSLRVVPTAAAVLGGGAGALLAGVPIDWTRVLHGEQRLRIHRPLPPSGRLLADSRVSELVDKGAGKGAILTVSAAVRLEDGSPLYDMDNVIFARGDGGFGGPVTRSAHAPHPMPDRPPDHVHASPTRPDDALLYRLNGDRNPLHADPAAAARAGFASPILHGLASYGIACRAVLARACGYDPGAMRRFDVRFTAPVYPGETLHTDLWVDGPTISFRCRVEARGAVVLNNGRCDLGR